MKIIKKLIEDSIILSLNEDLKQKLTSIEPNDSKNVFSQIKHNFRQYEPLDLDVLKIPKQSISLLNNINVEPNSLRK